MYRKKEVYPKFEKTTGFKLDKIISLEDPILTIKTILYLFALIKVSSWLGDKYIVLIILNVFIFYSPINKRFPHFLFFIPSQVSFTLFPIGVIAPSPVITTLFSI